MRRTLAEIVSERIALEESLSFVFEVVDQALASVRYSFCVDGKTVARYFGESDVRRIEMASRMELPPALAAGWSEEFGVRVPNGDVVQVRRSLWLDELPYAIHTNRELLLMLQGTKPLAAFSAHFKSEQEFLHLDHFHPFVAQGMLVERRFSRPDAQGRHAEIALFARRGEEWRLDAYIALWDAASAGGWSIGLERLEGLLLGYESWQTDAFLEARAKRL